MTNQVKNDILKYFINQKLFGYSYHNHLNLHFYNSFDSTLPNTLEALEDSATNCYLCDLSKSRKCTLFGYGNKKSKLMFVCDEVTKSEDESNTFYSGNSGELLSTMIEKVLKLRKEEVYISNLLKCKSPKEASSSDLDTCSSYLFKQIEIIKPKIIVAVGEKVYKYLMKDENDFLKNRGKSFDFYDTLLIPIFSPLHLIKNPSLKKDTYLDMLKIKNLYEGI